MDGILFLEHSTEFRFSIVCEEWDFEMRKYIRESLYKLS